MSEVAPVIIIIIILRERQTRSPKAIEHTQVIFCMCQPNLKVDTCSTCEPTAIY